MSSTDDDSAVSSATIDTPTSAPLPRVVPQHFQGLQGRRLLLHGTAAGAVAGAAFGCVHSVRSGRPLLRCLLSGSVNVSLLSFMFVGSSLLLSQAAPSWLQPAALPNQMLAGALTVSLLSGWQRAAKGQVTTARDAATVSARGVMAGAVAGAVVWTARWAFHSWMARRTDKGELRIEQHEPSATDEPQSAGVASWSPIRPATADDLQRHEALKERRRQWAMRRGSSRGSGSASGEPSVDER